MEIWQLRQMQNLPLEVKIEKTKLRIKEWYEHWDGNVFVSFSGGKDSTVLLHIVRQMYPDIPGVFADTGLEYPEIREFIKTTDNVVWMKPKKPFTKIINEYGYPVVSKKVARFIRDMKKPVEKNPNTQNLRLTGYNQKGAYCPSMILPKKWRYLIDSPFKISEQCCDYMKKEPFHRYQKETGRKPITGVMADEGQDREKNYLKYGCNAFNAKEPISKPLSFWVESDIWEYLMEFNVPYSAIYDKGEIRTGCMFCMFGCHLEKNPNRFQRMAITHPKQYDYCINKLGLGKVLDYIGVEYDAI